MADLLRISLESFSKERAADYSDWVSDSVKNNMPYDQFVTDLLTATGSTSKVQPANKQMMTPCRHQLLTHSMH